MPNEEITKEKETREITLKDALKIAVKKQSEGKLDEAQIIYSNILKIYPKDINTLHLLGLINYQKGNSQEAIEKIKQAIEIKPEALFYHNLGMIYDSIKENEKSADCFQKALQLNPNYENVYLAHYNLGIYFKENEEIEKAIEHYNLSIRLNPNFPESRWNRSLLLLLEGNLKEGFDDFDYRFKKSSPTDSRTFKSPKWNNESLKDKTLLIISEQGAGDTIQFSRYISLIKKENTKIILECKPELKELLKSIEEIDEFKEKEDLENTNYDYYIHLMSLPKIFQTTSETIPHDCPYLKAPEELINKFESLKNSNADKLKVGICWAGNPLQEDDKTRSSSFEDFKILEEIPNIQIFSLQKGASQLNHQNNSKITNLANDINNFQDTAALIENMDLIISVDTSVTHLAGALNKPVWTLLSKTPDWRYLLEGNSIKWYPSMKLFRQKTKGDWRGIMEEVKSELQKLLNGNT